MTTALQHTTQNAPMLWGELATTRVGTLSLAWSTAGLRQISFGKISHNVERVSVPNIFTDPLLAYFSGENVDFSSVPLDLEGTAFQRRVWSALRKIPYGQVRTYGFIANDVGSPRGMRAVGAANGANPIPIIIPCHRVVEMKRTLGGFSGGLDNKRALLTLEGCTLDGDTVMPGQLSFL